MEDKGVKGEKPRRDWKVLMYPHLAEKSMNMVEMENKLVFIVQRNARKSDIKEEVERVFDVKVKKVNVEITRKGNKKAYVKLHPEYSAADIASRLGML
ncbi:MAG TPA: 50S ribosomal protein L23 [Candidatus Aenigmarchaeota archaeon]|nr:50S ribosomal protein L23 [Candidatus Aenigmarchaeota archaeon]